MRSTSRKVMVSLFVCLTITVVFTEVGLNRSDAIDPKDRKLAGAWLFDEGQGNKANDLSKHKTHGKIINAEWVQGVRGTALKFNGKDTYVEIGHSANINFAGKDKISIACWIHMTGFGSNWGRIVDKNPVNRSYTMTRWSSDNFVLWRPVTQAGRIDVRSSTLERDKWYHIVGVYDGKEARSYLNGKLDKTVKEGGGGKLGRADLPLVIGGDPKFGGRPSWFEGMIDEVLIFSKVLTEKEIGEIHRSGLLAVEPVEKLTTAWGNIKKQER